MLFYICSLISFTTVDLYVQNRSKSQNLEISCTPHWSTYLHPCFSISHSEDTLCLALKRGSVSWMLHKATLHSLRTGLRKTFSILLIQRI